MIPRRTSSVPKEDVFLRLPYSNSRGSQTCRQHCQDLPGGPRCTQSSLLWSEVFPNLTQSLPWYSWTSHQRSLLLSRPAGMPSLVLYSSNIDTSKFTLHILSDTPGGFQWLKYIFLMGGAWKQFEVRLKTTIMWTQRSTLRLWLNNFGVELGGGDWVIKETRLEVAI